MATGGLAFDDDVFGDLTDEERKRLADEELAASQPKASGADKFGAGLSGAAKGAATGASLGATLGSVVPGIGTAVGGLAGAGLGALAGGVGGAMSAQPGQGAGGAVGDVTKSAKSMAQLAKDKGSTELEDVDIESWFPQDLGG